LEKGLQLGECCRLTADTRDQRVKKSAKVRNSVFAGWKNIVDVAANPFFAAHRSKNTQEL
jgi:hypothetical protein